MGAPLPLRDGALQPPRELRDLGRADLEHAREGLLRRAQRNLRAGDAIHAGLGGVLVTLRELAHGPRVSNRACARNAAPQQMRFVLRDPRSRISKRNNYSPRGPRAAHEALSLARNRPILNRDFSATRAAGDPRRRTCDSPFKEGNMSDERS